MFINVFRHNSGKEKVATEKIFLAQVRTSYLPSEILWGHRLTTFPVKSLAKEIESTSHSKLDRALIWLFFRFQHTCVSYDTQLVNKIKLSLSDYYFDNGFCIYGNARCFESDDNMAMMTKPFQAKYAVSYTTINAFVPDRTPRCYLDHGMRRY